MNKKKKGGDLEDVVLVEREIEWGEARGSCWFIEQRERFGDWFVVFGPNSPSVCFINEKLKEVGVGFKVLFVGFLFNKDLKPPDFFVFSAPYGYEIRCECLKGFGVVFWLGGHFQFLNVNTEKHKNYCINWNSFNWFSLKIKIIYFRKK